MLALWKFLRVSLEQIFLSASDRVEPELSAFPFPEHLSQEIKFTVATVIYRVSNCLRSKLHIANS